MKFKSDSNRVFGLDIFRALAIILVVLQHGKFILEGSALENFPYIKMLDGVDMFFVLSGFLIGGILLKEINQSDQFGKKVLFNFWKRRWFRTLPNYYLVLALNYFVVKHGIINENIEKFSFHFLTFTHNFRTPFSGFFWESWSLSIEEWFYIITPILCFILLKILSPKKAFLISTLVMIIFPFVYRIYIFNPIIDGSLWDRIFRKTVLCRLDSIGYGLLFSWFYYYYYKTWNKIRLPFCLAGIAIILFILNFQSDSTTFYKQVVYFSLVPFAVMLLLPIAESIKNAEGIIAHAVQHISKISYSMYLINLALVAEVIRDNFSPQGGVDSIIKYLSYWLIVIVVSSLLYRYFEKPITDLRNKELRFLWYKNKDSSI